MAATTHKRASTAHRHAAIMFTDIVGYTSLMGSDEDKAFEVLRKNRKIHTKYIEQFKGTLIKEMGDGMLISFDLASDAVRCAVEIQKVCKAQDIPLKIGIHEGELVFEGDDVLGDGVNIASRIQDKAGEGCILISGSVYQDIKNKGDIQADFLGEQNLKNVDGSIKIFQVQYKGGPDKLELPFISMSKPVHSHLFLGSTKVKITSILVLLASIITLLVFISSRSIPFEEEDWIITADFNNLTGDSVFDRSLNTALEVSLQQSAYVNVYPNTKIMQTLTRMGKDNATRLDEETAIEIAKREGIKIIVVCSISKIGNVYSLSSRIVEVATGETLKSTTFKAKNKNQILKTLDRLGRSTRRDLGESVKKIDYWMMPLPQATTSSLAALKCFAQGIDAWTTRSNDEEAIGLFNEAIRLDSGFALAYSYLGSIYYWNSERILGESYFKKALGMLDRLTEKEKLAVEARVEKFRGNYDAAIIKYNIFLRKYPNSPSVWFNLGHCYMLLRKYDKAVEAFEKSVAMVGGEEANTMINLAACYSGLKDFKKSIEFYQRGFKLNPNLWMVSNLNHEFGFACVEAGKIDLARNTFEKLSTGDNGQKARAHRSLALLCIYQGKMTEAAEHLKESILLNRTIGYYLSELRDRLFLVAVYRMSGDFSNRRIQLQEIENIERIHVVDPWWLFLCAKEFARYGQVTKAEQYLIKISKRINEGNRVDEASYYLLKGEIELAKGNIQNALDLVETGINLRDDAFTKESLAHFYLATNNLEQAKETYQDIIHTSNTLGWEAQAYWIEAHKNLGDIYFQSGQSNKAMEYYTKFIDIWEDADTELPDLELARANLEEIADKTE